MPPVTELTDWNALFAIDKTLSKISNKKSLEEPLLLEELRGTLSTEIPIPDSRKAVLLTCGGGGLK